MAPKVCAKQRMGLPNCLPTCRTICSCSCADVYEVLAASHYTLLTKEEWDLATSENFNLNLPMEVRSFAKPSPGHLHACISLLLVVYDTSGCMIRAHNSRVLVGLTVCADSGYVVCAHVFLQVNWDYMDKDLLEKFWESSPSRKALRQTLPDCMAVSSNADTLWADTLYSATLGVGRFVGGFDALFLSASKPPTVFQHLEQQK